MLNSCGHALSQGDGSDFNPWCNWEATPPGYRAWVRAWRWLAPHHRATPVQTYYGSPVKLEKYGNSGSCSQLWEESGMVQQKKIGDGILKQGVAAMQRLFRIMGLGQRKTIDFYFFFWDTVSWTGQRGDGRTVSLWVFQRTLGSQWRH